MGLCIGRFGRLLVVVASVSCSARLGIGGELPRTFVEAYRPALQKLEKTYTNATVEGTISHQLPQEHKSREQNFVYWAAGTSARLDATTTASQGMGGKLGSTQILLATPGASMRASRGPRAPAFETAKELSDGDARSSIETTCRLYQPYALDERENILEHLKRDSVKIVSYRQVTLEGRSVVKISYTETRSEAGQKGVWKAWLVLSPSDGWALREYSRTIGEGARQVTFQGSLDYEGVTDDGVPLVSRIDFWQQRGSSQEYVERDVINITRFVQGAPSPYYFRAMGLNVR